MPSLAVKYRPTKFEDITEQSIVAEMLKSICESDTLGCRNFLLTGPAGCGKAQPLYSKVLTPDGFITMGQVAVGTEVFTDKGAIAKVSGVYPQGRRKIFEIELQDHTKIRVADNHLNVVWRYNEDRKQREDFVLDTEGLINLFHTSRFRLRIDIPEVDWKEKPVPIDPYLLGALLGDGSIGKDNFGFSNSESDVVEKVDTILRRDWNCKLVKLAGDNVDYSISPVDRRKHIFTYKGEEYTRPKLVKMLVSEGYPKVAESTLIRICDGTATYYCHKYPELQKDLSYRYNQNYDAAFKLKQVLKSMKLDTMSVEKHVPDIYLRNSKYIREQLLQGLFDTDGYSSGRTTEFSTSSYQLSKDFEFLVRSLGARDSVSEYASSYVNKQGDRIKCHVSYNHVFKLTNEIEYCSSIKHKERSPKYQNAAMRNIVSIRYVGVEECQCIMVDHPDHTYISDGFIPTHNTTLAKIMANVLNDGKGSPIELDAASHSGVDNMRELIQQARAMPIGTKYKVFIIDEAHALSSAAWQALLLPIEAGVGNSVFMFATTNPEKIPDTIISRVQTFQLSKISLKGIQKRLKYIVDAENSEGAKITYTEDALNYLAKLANGGMRDAITLLDKSLSYSTDITTENLMKSLNLPNYDDFFELLNAYARKDNTAIATIVNRVYNSGVNFTKWFTDFHSFVINIVKYILLQDINETMIPSVYQEKISSYTVKHSTVCLKLANKLVTLNHELRTTSYLQELALTYLCAIPKKGE